MAQRVEIFQVTAAAGTLQSAAAETPLEMAPGIVRELEIIIPSGHAGLTGLAIAQAHQIIIPSKGSVWIIGDGEPIRWPLDNFLDADTWSAYSYNTDPLFPHSWYLRFLVDEIEAPVTAGSTPIAVQDIYAAATGGSA